MTMREITQKDKTKVFLSDSPYEMGYIAFDYKVNHRSGGEYYDYNIVQGQVKIADCDHSICLDFSCNNLKALRKRISKLQLIINTLQRMLDGYEKVYRIASRKSKVY